MKKIFLLLTICLTSICAFAANTYVKPNGNNSNDGSSWAKAKQTITKGLSNCSNGDTLFVAAGTYNERVGGLKNGVAILGGYNASTGERDIDQY